MSISSISVHKYPECENIWTSLTEDEQVLLLDFSLQIWDATENSFNESASLEQFSALEEKNIVIQEDGKWRFVFAQMLPFVQAIALINTLALHSRSVDALFQELVGLVYNIRNESHERRRECNVVISFIIARLIKAYHRIDVLEFIVSQECSNDSFWQFQSSICDVVPILDLSIEVFAQTFQHIVERTRNDYAGGRILPAAEYLGVFQPSVGIQLIDYISHTEDWEYIEILERLMTGVAYSQVDHFEFIVATCEKWLNSDTEKLCQAALSCARNLILADKLEHNWILSRASLLISQSSKNTRITLSFILSRLGISSHAPIKKYRELLVQLKQLESEGEVAHGIASALAHDDTVPLEFRLSCLLLLTNVPQKNKGTIKQIGWVLYPLTRSHPEEVWNYLAAWVLAHNDRTMIAQHDMFLPTIQDTYQHNPGLGTLILTQWFSSSDLQLVEEARVILRKLNVSAFSQRELSSMPLHIVEYITEKLLAGGFDGPQTLTLLFSILRYTNNSKELEQHFLEVLRSVTWNYPGSAAKFFEQVCDKDDKSLPFTLLQKAQQELEEYQAQHKNVFAQELAPSKHRVERYRKFEAKSMQIAQDALTEDEQSPLLGLVSHVTIGRGNRTFHMYLSPPDLVQKRMFSMPNGFAEFSDSIELPRMEIIDPEGEVIWRLRRRTYIPDDFLG